MSAVRMLSISTLFLVASPDVHAGVCEWLWAKVSGAPKVKRARMTVGYEPDSGTEAGLFTSDRTSQGIFSETGATLDGNSVWVSALDGTFQSRMSYSIHPKGSGYGVPTLVSQGIETDGIARGMGLESAVLGRAIERNPAIQEVRVKVRAPTRWDWNEPEAHQFALNLARKVEQNEGRPEGVLDRLPEYETLVKKGFTFDSKRTGLWHYSKGDVDHYFLYFTRPPQ